MPKQTDYLYRAPRAGDALAELEAHGQITNIVNVLPAVSNSRALRKLKVDLQEQYSKTSKIKTTAPSKVAPEVQMDERIKLRDERDRQRQRQKNKSQAQNYYRGGMSMKNFMEEEDANDDVYEEEIISSEDEDDYLESTNMSKSRKKRIEARNKALLGEIASEGDEDEEEDEEVEDLESQESTLPIKKKQRVIEDSNSE